MKNLILIGNLIDHYIQKRPENRIRERKNSFISFYKTFGHVKVSDIKEEKLLKWFRDIQKENQYRERNLNNVKVPFNIFFKFLVEEEIIQKNPMGRIKFNNKKHPPKRTRIILSKEEVHFILRSFKLSFKDFYPFIMTLTFTGARRNEIRCLKWIDLDFQNRIIHINKSKNGERRSIKMTEELKQMLLKEKEKSRSEYVFTTHDHIHLTRKRIQRAIIKFHEVFPNQKQWRCHDLRHSYAYHFLKNGGNMYQLQALLGHKTIGMTIDLYGQLSALDVGEVVVY